MSTIDTSDRHLERPTLSLGERVFAEHVALSSDSARQAAHDDAVRARNHFAALEAARAAKLIRRVFGDTAHRAIFERDWDSETARNGYADFDLIAVYDSAGALLWYDPDSCLHGTLAVRDRDEIEAYGGPPTPHLDEQTAEAIESLAENAEDWGPEGWLSRAEVGGVVLAKGEYDGEPYDDTAENVYELIVPGEIAHARTVARSVYRRAVDIFGMTEQQLRGLEKALGLVTGELGRLRGGTVHIGMEYTLADAARYAQLHGLAYEETNTTLHPARPADDEAVGR